MVTRTSSTSVAWVRETLGLAQSRTVCCLCGCMVTHHLVWRRAEAKQNKRHSPSACAREIASTPSTTACWTLACPEETVEKTMLHSVSGLATMVRSTSVERYARMCEPRGTARARTANSLFDSGSNNFRNGMSGYLLNKQRKPGRVSRANDANNKLIGHGCPILRLPCTEPWTFVHRRMPCHTSRRAILHRH